MFMKLISNAIGAVLAILGIVIVIGAHATDNSAEIAAANTAKANQEVELVRPLTDTRMRRAYLIGKENGSIKNSQAELTNWEKNFLNQIYANLKRNDEERERSRPTYSDGESMHDLGW